MIDFSPWVTGMEYAVVVKWTANKLPKGDLLAQNLALFLNEVAKYRMEFLENVALVAMDLKLIKSADDMSLIGAKALQSPMFIEDFTAKAKYIEFLQNKVQLTNNIFIDATPIERVAYKALGAVVLNEGIGAICNMNITIYDWCAIAKTYLSGNSYGILRIFEAFKSDFTLFTNYIEGKSTQIDYERVRHLLGPLLKEIDSIRTVYDIEDDLDRMWNAAPFRSRVCLSSESGAKISW